MSKLQGLLGSIAGASHSTSQKALWEWDSNNYNGSAVITTYPDNINIVNTYNLIGVEPWQAVGGHSYPNGSTGTIYDMFGGSLVTPNLNDTSLWTYSDHGLTVDIWFLPTALDGTLLSMLDDPDNPGYFANMLEVRDNGYVVGMLWDGSSLQHIQSTTVVTVEQWNHVNFRYDFGTQVFTLSLNNDTAVTGSVDWQSTTDVGSSTYFGLCLGSSTGVWTVNNLNASVGICRIFNYDIGENLYNLNYGRFNSAPALPSTPLLVLDAANINIGGSLVFNGTNNYVFIDDSTDLDISGAFTWEGYFYNSNWGATNVLYSQDSYGATGHIGVYTALSFMWVDLFGNIRAPLPVDTIWTHIAIQRDASDNVTIWYNGVQKTIEYFSGGWQSASSVVRSGTLSPRRPCLGYSPTEGNGSGFFTGKMTSVRMSNIARYTGTFSPPVNPYVSDVNTLYLFNVISNGTKTVDSSNYHRVNSDVFKVVATYSGTSSNTFTINNYSDVFWLYRTPEVNHAITTGFVESSAFLGTDTVVSINGGSPPNIPTTITLSTNTGVTFNDGDTMTFYLANGVELAYSSNTPNLFTVWEDTSGNNHNATIGSGNGSNVPSTGIVYSYNIITGLTASPTGYVNFSYGQTWFNAGTILTAGDYSKVAFVKITDASSANIISGSQTAFWLAQQLKIQAGNNGTWNTVIYNTVINLNQWYMFAMSYNSVTGDWALYIDGNQVATNVYDNPITQTEPVYIGSHAQSPSLGAQFGVALVYNSALSGADMTTIYNRYRGRYAI